MPYRVTHAIAAGEGEWAEVPRSVREAVLSALHSPHSAAAGPERPPGPGALTEAEVQRSVQTFEDAEWVRGQALRSFAQFHNNVEALYASFGDQCRPLWRTAMQLHPAILSDVRARTRLLPHDDIPSGVAIPDERVGEIVEQERVLGELAAALARLREGSVRFAAHFLTDAEKRALGADPAYLRKDDIEREVSQSASRLSGPARSPRSPGGLPSPPRPVAADTLPDISALDRSSDPYLEELRHEYMLRVAELSSVAGGTPRGPGPAPPHSAETTADRNDSAAPRRWGRRQSSEHRRRRERRRADSTRGSSTHRRPRRRHRHYSSSSSSSSSGSSSSDSVTSSSSLDSD